MSDNIRSLVKEHQAFYEVAPYYVLLEERHGNLPPTTRRIQAGFDIDIYGVETDKNKLELPQPDEYELGYEELKKMAEEVSHHISESCSLEVIPFPSEFVIDVRHHGNVEATLRLRISHCRGLDQPAGLPEQQALAEVEKQLHSMGLARR